jgi:hypothetical protein
MIALVKAIINKYEKGQDLKRVSSNGMWLGLAPQGTVVPYITYNVISDNPIYTSTDIVGDYLVQFSMFAKDIETAIIMYEELEKLYNIRTLAIKNDDDFVVCSRENSTGPVLIDETWMVTADYQIMIRASRTAELII